MTTLSPPIAIMLTRLLAAPARTPVWRSFLEKQPAVRAAWAARCIFSTRNITCTAATPLSPRTFRWPLGLAFASNIVAKIALRFASFGDGAINQGAFHEALNLAALYKLPIVFICENNLFAMGTTVKRSTSLKQIVDRAEGYDIPGDIVDGMNFREVRDKLAEIVDSIRKDPHPAFVEIRTYRYRGHSMSDPASYRTKEELEKFRLDDPITRLRAQLTREGKLTNEQFDLMDKRAKETALASA